MFTPAAFSIKLIVAVVSHKGMQHQSVCGNCVRYINQIAASVQVSYSDGEGTIKTVSSDIIQKGLQYPRCAPELPKKFSHHARMMGRNGHDDGLRQIYPPLIKENAKIGDRGEVARRLVLELLRVPAKVAPKRGLGDPMCDHELDVLTDLEAASDAHAQVVQFVASAYKTLDSEATTLKTYPDIVTAHLHHQKVLDRRSFDNAQPLQEITIAMPQLVASNLSGNIGKVLSRTRRLFSTLQFFVNRSHSCKVSAIMLTYQWSRV
jgi:hypothetical protein